MKQNQRFRLGILKFLGPSLVIILIFFLIPILFILFLSFTNMSTRTGFDGWKWVGLANYLQMIHHPKSAQNLWTTLKYLFLTLTFFNMGMAFVIALLALELPKRTGIFFRSLWLLPRITPSVVYVLMWKYLGADAPYGLFNWMLQPLGVEPQYWVNAQPFLFVVLVNGYIGASFGMIIFTSAIESIPKDFIHAAMLDGASYFHRLRHIILPTVKWPVLFVLTFQTLSLLTSFEQILILTDGANGTEVWSLWAYHTALNNYWGNFNWGFGAALGTILMIIAIFFCVIYLRFFKFTHLVGHPKLEIRS